jgi:hypothetical protein
MDKWRILCSTGVLRGNMRKKYEKISRLHEARVSASVHAKHCKKLW